MSHSSNPSNASAAKPIVGPTTPEQQRVVERIAMQRERLTLDRIRRFLALDRLAVGTDQNQDNDNRSQGASVETGRYVADGVYVGVRQGTDGGPPRVGVQVDVLPRVRVEAETGGNSSAGDRLGLSFEFEY